MYNWQVTYTEYTVKTEVLTWSGKQLGRGLCHAHFKNLDTGEGFFADFYMNKYSGFGSYLVRVSGAISHGSIFAQLSKSLTNIDVAISYTSFFKSFSVDGSYSYYAIGVAKLKVVHGRMEHRFLLD